MAISSTSSAQSLSSGIVAQIQQQQAQRNADQAEQQARSLQFKARDAQLAANRAQEGARSLKVKADQAQGDASSARQGLAALKSLGETNAQLSELRDQINSALKTPARADSSTDAAAVVAPGGLAPVVNAFGEPTGTVVNVTA